MFVDVFELIWKFTSLFFRFFKNIVTPNHPFVHFLFLSAILLCAWNLMRASTIKPGYAPVPISEAQRREIVHQLAEDGKLNGMNFCIPCLVSLA